MLLYPVYTLLFSDTGLSVWQISSLFVIWSVSSLVLEVPSGAWADADVAASAVGHRPTVDRGGVRAVGGLTGVLGVRARISAVGAERRLTSGALEALVYEELQRLDATEKYATLMGRGEVAGVLAAMLAGAVAAPVLAAGGFGSRRRGQRRGVPAGRAGRDAVPGERNGQPRQPELGWAGALAAGWPRRDGRPIRSAVILVAVVASVWGALDEYTPLLMESTGVSDADVSLLMVLIWAGARGRPGRGMRRPLASLAWLAAALRRPVRWRPPASRLRRRRSAAASSSMRTVVADTRLQDSISGRARATVTSLAGMSTDVATLVVYGSYAALAGIGGHGGAFAVLMLPYLAVAVWLLWPV